MIVSVWVTTTTSERDATASEDGSEFELYEVLRYLFSLGLKVSPLTGAKALKSWEAQDTDRNYFYFAVIQIYYLIQSVMLYSMLTALLSNRLVKSEDTRVTRFQLSFAKLVISEHQRRPAPPPLQALGSLARLLAVLRHLDHPNPEPRRAHLGVLLDGRAIRRERLVELRLLEECVALVEARLCRYARGGGRTAKA